MISFFALKNSVMPPLIRFIIRHPNVMRSPAFLQAMRVFPEKISGSYDTRMEENTTGYQAVLAQGMVLIDSQPQTILDIGTGTGIAAFTAARAFPKAHIIGIDQSIGMIALAIEKLHEAEALRISFVHGNACNLAFDDQTFDLVVSSNAPIYLDEATRVLKFGGYLLVAFSFAKSAFLQNEVDIRKLLEVHGVELLHMKGLGEGVIIFGKKYSS